MGLGQSLGSLFVELVAGLAPYKKDLQEAGNATKNFAATADREMSKVGQAMAKAQTAATNFVSSHSAALKATGTAMTAFGGAIVGAVALSVKGYAEMGDALDEMSQRTGVSAKTLSELGYAARLTGTSLDGVERAVKLMQKKFFGSAAEEAADELDELGKKAKPAEKTLAELGLKLTDIQNLTPEKAFNKLLTALGNVPDANKKAALALEIFGKAGTSLLPMIAKGSEELDRMKQEAVDLGYAFTDDGAVAAGKLNDAMASLKMGLVGIRNEIASQLLPSVQAMVDRMTEAVKGIVSWSKAHPALSSQLTQFAIVLGGVMVAVGPLLVSLPILIGLLGSLGAALGAILTGGTIGLIVAGLTSIAVSIWGIIQANRSMAKSMVDQQKWLKDSAKGYEDLGVALQKVAGGAAVWGRVQNAMGQSQKAADLMQIAFYGTNEQVKATAASLGIVGTILKTQRSALKDRAVLEQDSANKLLNIYTKQANTMTTPKGISPMPGAAPVKEAKDSGFAEAAYKAAHTAQQNEMYDLDQLQAKYLKAGENKVAVAKWYSEEKKKIDDKYLAQAQAVEEQIAQATTDAAIAGITDKYAAQEATAKDKAAKDIAKFEGTEDQKARYAIEVNKALQAELIRISSESEAEKADIEKKAATELALKVKEAALSGITDKFAAERQALQDKIAEETAAYNASKATEADKAAYAIQQAIILSNRLKEIDADETTFKLAEAKRAADGINKIEVDAAQQYIATLQHRKDLTAEAEIAILETKRAALVAGTDAYNIYTQEIQALTDTLGVTIEEKWTHMLENIKLKFGEWGQAASDFVGNFVDAFANGIGNLIVGAQSFGDFFTGMMNALKNMVVQFVVDMIKKWIMGMLMNKVIKTSQALTEIGAASASAAAWAIASQMHLGWLGLASGAALAASAIGLIAATSLPLLAGATAAAAGGVFTSPTLALIGEAGPEAVIPLKDSAGLGGMSMGKGEVNVHFYHYGNVETAIDYDLLKKDFAGIVIKAMRAS